MSIGIDKWISVKETLEIASRESGVDISYDSYRKLVKNGIPKPHKVSRGRARGVEGVYPVGFAMYLAQILTCYKSGMKYRDAISFVVEDHEVLLSIEILQAFNGWAYSVLIRGEKQKKIELQGELIILVSDGVQKNKKNINRLLLKISMVEQSQKVLSSEYLQLSPRYSISEYPEYEDYLEVMIRHKLTLIMNFSKNTKMVSSAEKILSEFENIKSELLIKGRKGKKRFYELMEPFYDLESENSD